LTNYSFSPTSRNEVMSSANITGVNFSATLLGSNISGTIVDNNGNPISGVTVAYTGTSSGSTTTASNGTYTLTGLANGNYTITPSLAKWTFSPTSRSETVNSANITGVNFTGSNVYSQPDARNYGNFPNDSINVNNTLQYTVPSVFSLRYWFDLLFNRTQPLPLDSRKAGAVADSRNGESTPENSRAPGTYGPGE
jgi:hypothetical protein